MYGIDIGLKYYGQDIMDLTETVCYNLINNNSYEGTLLCTVNMGGDNPITERKDVNKTLTLLDTQ